MSPLPFPQLRAGLAIAVLSTAVFASMTLRAQRLDPATLPTRGADEDVKTAEVRERAGLAPGRNLLHTGWGVTPAGAHVRVSDMPLKMIVSPDRRMLVTVNGGFNDTGVTLLDLRSRQVSQFLPLKECWNGL